MIHKIKRLGTAKENESKFLINGLVKAKYIKYPDYTDIKVEFNDEDITKIEAYKLAKELSKSAALYKKSLF